MVFNATFNNISVISWWSVLLVEETGENYRPVASHWQTLSAFLFWLKQLNLNILVSSFHNDMVLYTKRRFLVICLTYNMDVNEHESPSICIQLHRDIIISDNQWYPKVSDSCYWNIHFVLPNETPENFVIQMYIDINIGQSFCKKYIQKQSNFLLEIKCYILLIKANDVPYNR